VDNSKLQAVRTQLIFDVNIHCSKHTHTNKMLRVCVLNLIPAMNGIGVKIKNGLAHFVVGVVAKSIHSKAAG
jgi:hypothetical protein